MLILALYPNLLNVSIDKKGSTHKYNKKTNEYAVITKDGYVVTYYKPATGYKYYIDQKKKKGKK